MTSYIIMRKSALISCFLLVIQELTEKMLEMVGITSLAIQREIISCIPEVLDDSEHTQVARELRYMCNHCVNQTVLPKFRMNTKLIYQPAN